MRGRIIPIPGGHRVVINLPPTEDGRYPTKWFTVRGKRKLAEEKLTELLYQMDKGTSLSSSKLKLGQYLDLWIKEVQHNLSYNSFVRYRGIVEKYVKPDIGQIPLDILRPIHVQKHLSDTRDEGLSPRTLRYHYSVLHTALKTALRRELVTQNIMDAVDPPDYETKEMLFWDAHNLNRFLQYCIGHRYYPLFYLALFTGMRRSEMLGLYWQDIDLVTGQLSVKRGYHRRDGTDTYSAPKSKHSIRTIALSPSTIEVFRKHLETKDGNLVFHRNDGRPLNPNTVTREWKKLCTPAGVPVIRLHDARHTHATILLSQGVHPKVVQERLGHSSISITLDLYSHIVPGLQESAAYNFDKVLIDL